MMNSGTQKITVKLNASGSWATLGHFDDTPDMRRELDETLAKLHWLSDKRTHFKLIDTDGKTLGHLKDGATRFVMEVA